MIIIDTINYYIQIGYPSSVPQYLFLKGQKHGGTDHLDISHILVLISHTYWYRFFTHIGTHHTIPMDPAVPSQEAFGVWFRG